MTIKGDKENNRDTEPTILVQSSNNLIDLEIEDLDSGDFGSIYLTKEQATKLAYEILKLSKPSSLTAMLYNNPE